MKNSKSITPEDKITPDWIKWAGGKCPVDPDTSVEIKYKARCLGASCTDADFADIFDWEHLGDTSDIIAYRVLNE